MELCEVFARCGLDVTLIAVANAVLTLLCRRLIKKLKPRMATVLSYACATLVYAVYASIAAGDAAYAFENLPAVAQKGLTAGTLTMLICAAFDRFTGGGSAVSAETATVMLLLEGVVEEDGRQACAEEILRLAGELGGEQLDEAVAAAIEDSGGMRDGVTEHIVARTAGRLACADGTQTD